MSIGYLHGPYAILPCVVFELSILLFQFPDSVDVRRKAMVKMLKFIFLFSQRHLRLGSRLKTFSGWRILS